MEQMCHRVVSHVIVLSDLRQARVSKASVKPESTKKATQPIVRLQNESPCLGTAGELNHGESLDQSGFACLETVATFGFPVLSCPALGFPIFRHSCRFCCAGPITAAGMPRHDHLSKNNFDCLYREHCRARWCLRKRQRSTRSECKNEDKQTEHCSMMLRDNITIEEDWGSAVILVKLRLRFLGET